MSQKNSYIFLASGFEEVEAMSTIDALRRAHIRIITVSIGQSLVVKGATGQIMMTDTLISDVDINDADWLIFPGGDPGAWNLKCNSEVSRLIQFHLEKGGRFAAICAAPAIVLAPLGVLQGKAATCYPLMADILHDHGAKYLNRKVVVEPDLITSQGPGTALDFAIEIIRATKGSKMADGIAAAMIVNP